MNSKNQKEKQPAPVVPQKEAETKGTKLTLNQS